MIFGICIGFLLGALVGAYLVNVKNASADKTYMDSIKQKMEIENIVTEEKFQNIISSKKEVVVENILPENEIEVLSEDVDNVENVIENIVEE